MPDDPEYMVGLRCLGKQTAVVQAAEAACLREGLRVVHGEGADLAAGVVFFDSLDEGVREAVRQLSRLGLVRVMVVAAAGCALAGRAAWALLEEGASDVVVCDQVHDPVASIVARVGRWIEVERCLRSPAVQGTLAGTSRSWRAVLRQVVEIARFTDMSVLITGESGTGKELVARLIHELDRRPNKGRFVVLDCTTVVPELSGSEFFGHERGAFTSAVAARDGAFALADGGTMFLDEVGELPLRLQAELLRVVQERTYKRVGSNVWRDANFRLICATNRDLQQEQARGAFREDFYHRLATWTCHLPPLAGRRDDILPLAAHFLKRIFRDQTPPGFSASVRDFLLGRSYPGNVRELQQLVTRLACRHVGPGPITLGALPEEEWARGDRSV